MILNRFRSVTFFGIIIILSFGSSILAEELTPAKRADIKKLMEITGAINIGLQFANMISQGMKQQAKSLSQDIPDRYFDVVDEVVYTFLKQGFTEQGGLFDEMITIYNKYFTHQEIKGLIEFYHTELGKKTIKILPKLMNESMIVGQQWTQRSMPKLIEILQTRLKEEGIELPK